MLHAIFLQNIFVIQLMNMKKQTLLIATFLIAVISLHAQIRKIPSEVTNAFNTKFPQAKNVEWKDNLTAFEADFKLDSSTVSASFSTKGEWQSTETKIPFETLPSVVQDGYKKSKYTDWKNKGVKKIEQAGKPVQYRIRIEKNSFQKKYLYFDEHGQLQRDEVTV
jgi:hypothetical protein